MKRFSAGLVAGLVAASSILIPVNPVPVHADVGEFAGAIDYFTSLSSEEVLGLGSGGFAVAAAVWAVQQALEHPVESLGEIEASSLACFSGIYYTDTTSTNRQYHVGTVSVYSGSFNVSDGDGIAFLGGDDYDVVLRFLGNYESCFSRATQNGTSQFIVTFGGLRASSTYAYQLYNYVDNDTAYTTASTSMADMEFNVGLGDAIPGYQNMASLARWAYRGESRPDLIGRGVKVDLPAGVINSDYVNTIIRWVNEYYPSYSFLFPEPPPDPIYPTDFVTGIPKDWTIVNPQLPEIPEIGIDKPTGDLPTISLAPYAHGVGFWWALVGEILDTTALKTMCITFLSVGLLIYCLWRLGR